MHQIVVLLVIVECNTRMDNVDDTGDTDGTHDTALNAHTIDPDPLRHAVNWGWTGT